MRGMTGRQKAAYRDPCARTAETIRRKFHADEGKWSTILTVNK
jgi:hypothetical protein